MLGILGRDIWCPIWAIWDFQWGPGSVRLMPYHLQILLVAIEFITGMCATVMPLQCGRELSSDRPGGLGSLACGFDSVPEELRKGVVLRPVQWAGSSCLWLGQWDRVTAEGGCPATRPVDSVVMPVAWTLCWWSCGRGLSCDQSCGLGRHACGLDSVTE